MRNVTRTTVAAAMGIGMMVLAPVSGAAAPGSLSQGANWTTYENAGMNIRFQVPPGWTTTVQSENGVPMLISASADETMSLLVYAYADEEISTEDLLDRTIENLAADIEGQAEEHEINGLHAWVAAGVGTVGGNEVGLVIMAATYDENNYVAYVFTDVSEFKRNADTMDAIINTFEPMER